MAESVPKTDPSAFYNFSINNATLHVPASSVDAYKAAYLWMNFGKIVGDATSNITRINTDATLIQCDGGVFKVQSIDEGTPVNVYRLNGTQAGSAISQGGAATINSNLQPGSIAIVKIGQKSVKVVIK